MGVSNASSKSFHVYFRTGQTIILGCGASGCSGHALLSWTLYLASPALLLAFDLFETKSI
jgi:hypothetical protein